MLKRTATPATLMVRDLLIHNSGLSTDEPWADRELDVTSVELRAFLKKGIHFSRISRTAFEYSNLGYAILGLVIENVTGKSYGQYISETICQPIGMKDAYWEYNDVAAKQCAQGYVQRDGVWQKEEMQHDGIYGAMGGMLTSIESFSRYVALHQSAWSSYSQLESAPLSKALLPEMHRPSIFREIVSNFNYSNGRDTVMVRSNREAVKACSHGREPMVNPIPDRSREYGESFGRY